MSGPIERWASELVEHTRHRSESLCRELEAEVRALEARIADLNAAVPSDDEIAAARTGVEEFERQARALEDRLAAQNEARAAQRHADTEECLNSIKRILDARDGEQVLADLERGSSALGRDVREMSPAELEQVLNGSSLRVEFRSRLSRALITAYETVSGLAAHLEESNALEATRRETEERITRLCERMRAEHAVEDHVIEALLNMAPADVSRFVDAFIEPRIHDAILERSWNLPNSLDEALGLSQGAS